MLTPDPVSFWPYGTPQQRRHCAPVNLSTEARPLQQRVQTDIPGMLAGARPNGPWTWSLKRARILAVLRRLVFAVLGRLWEGSHQAGACGAG